MAVAAFSESLRPPRLLRHRRGAWLTVAACGTLLFATGSLASAASGARDSCFALPCEGANLEKDALSATSKAERARDILREADAVCFDVDSTVVVTEGIDLLAKCFGVEEAVSQLTRRAMEGGMPFRDALHARLELIRPTKFGLMDCLEGEGKQDYSPGIVALVDRLHALGKEVFLISGGFRVMIEPIADGLGIPKENIFANTVFFDERGEYSGFDADEPTSRDHGKSVVIERLMEERGFRHVLMIGDGATDLQARPPASAFIGYGGVHVREKVEEGADWFVRDFAEVLAALAEL